MRAKRVPQAGEKLAGRRSEVAAAYGLTVEEFNRYYYEFVQSEGFDADGNEYETLHDYLLAGAPAQAAEPFQKSDLDYGL